MQLLQHLCGQPLERAAGLHGRYYQLTWTDHAGGFATAVERCPRCNEPLSDTDMLDRTGVPIVLSTPSAQSSDRQAALAGLAAGYTLRWEDAQWRIQAGDTSIAFADTLDAIVQLASAITVQDKTQSAEAAPLVCPRDTGDASGISAVVVFDYRL